MKDIRLITLNSDNSVDLDASKMFMPLTPLESAIQRIVLCLVTTQGTLVDAPGWGGDAYKALLKNRTSRQEDIRNAATEIISKTQQSLVSNEPIGDPYKIIGLSVVDVEKMNRGWRVKVRVIFESATSITVGIPNVAN